MNKTIFEFMLEQHFSDFDFGDAIQVSDDYIYFEFQMNGGDRKMRIPFDFDTFQRVLSKPFTTPLVRDLYISSYIGMIKTEILKNLLDLKEEE